LVLELVNTLTNGLAEGSTLGDGLLAVSTADANAIDNIALLGLVTKTASLVGTRWAGGAVDDVQLTVLPAPHTKEKAEDIRLFFLIEFSNVFVCAHLSAFA
jgi:hypothetical protein